MSDTSSPEGPSAELEAPPPAGPNQPPATDLGPAASGVSVGGPPSRRVLAALSLAALGVVYGDIGTSPLYALKECFTGLYSVPLTVENVLGVLSLIFWSLNFIVSLKYLALMMRMDNRGEGGIMALLALLRPGGSPVGIQWVLVTLALFGSSLLYGDGIITPAITVLGAMEGLVVATPAMEHWVVPLTVTIIIGLFLFQRRGTAGVGAVFGPVMVVWFASIAVLGVRGIVQHPGVLRAIDPWYAADFFLRDRLQGFLVLAAVVLVVTGAEALYADMGHFGRRPIRLAWFVVVLPALLLNYFGQGAQLLTDPAARANPFYSLVPAWALYPMVVIATSAAVVASQALISGAFSLTRQAVQLGYSPRVTIVHTSSTLEGQIYIPEINWAIGAACVALVLTFRSSANLASTYGLATTGTMAITAVLFFVVARRRWKWSVWRAGPLTALFLAVDLSFFGANLVKIPTGGWFPLAVAAGVYVLMSTWKRGRQSLARILRDESLPLDLFLKDIAGRRPTRVPGVAVFMSSDPVGTPPVLLHHVKHNKVLHEKVVLVSVESEEIPQVPARERVELKEMGQGFYQVIAHYGFMETPDVPLVLGSLVSQGLEIQPMQTTFYLGRETLLATGRSKMARWRKRLFIIMTRNAQPASAFFGLPPNRVVEMGAQIQI